MEAMNKWVRDQEKLGQEITKLLSNSKKDSTTRKTGDYCKKRLTTLEEYWGKIVSNHEEISKLGESHKYFEVDYYGQLKRLYEDAKSYFMEVSKTILSDPEAGKDPDAESKSENIRMKKQQVRMQQLRGSMNQVEEELTEERTKLRYETLLKKISKQWEAVYDLNEEIMVAEEDFSSPYFQTDEFDRMEREYEKVSEKLQIKISNFAVTETKSNVNLPKIKIPFFDGNYESWSTFHDIYFKVIHNNASLTNTEKMQYLKSYIKGEPSRLIHHLQINEINYEAAWELLKKRYQNTRLLLNKFLDKILDMQVITEESAYKLRQLHDTALECLKAINNLGIDTASWGPMISRIIARKWDSETNRIYEQSVKEPHQLQDFQELMRFLETRFQSLEVISHKKSSSTEVHKTPNTYSKCQYCMQSHPIYKCPKLQALSTSERAQFVKTKNLCQNCLTHDRKDTCKSKTRCRFCNKAHHSLLHFNASKQRQNVTAETAGNSNSSPSDRRNTAQQASTSTAISNHVGSQENSILLATALVQATKRDGTLQFLRVLIDTGSQASFITEEAAQILGNPKRKVHAEINGLGTTEPKIINYKVDAQLKSRFPSEFFINVELLVLPKLTQTMPQQPFNVDLEEWKNHVLADPTFNKPGPIDIILGTQEYCQIIAEGIRKLGNGLLGQNTEFGWILSGNIPYVPSKSMQVVSMISRVNEDQDLTKFWEIEEVDLPSVETSASDYCKEFYTNTTKRNQDGTYTVRIPFNEKIEDIGYSKARAISRFLQLEKRLSRDESLKEQYVSFMDEYLELGHMKMVSSSDEVERKYYIPHQPVTREESTTTKLRVVFDASSKTSTNVSLNEAMHTGPRLQQDLSDILLRWRKYEIVMTADIEKMYRQIKIDEADQRYHRILWRSDPSKPIQEFELTTITYGTTAAPYLAIRTLQQLAHDEEQKFPIASKTTLSDFYVDDLISGSNSTEEAAILQTELIRMMAAGGFKLRKWSSNDQALLSELPEELKEVSELELSKDGTKKTLGIHWAPHNDIFKIRVQPSVHQRITKRSILSEVAKIFDPLGWLAPVIIQAKLLIQELWLQNLRWDQVVSEESRSKWLLFHCQLKSMEDITLPRWISYHPNKNQVELHGFCDASEKAYGAVIYSKTTEIQSGKIKITLLIAKSKVAPIKSKTTLPRLELCAALLLAKLMKKTIAALQIVNPSVYGWSDSMITLSWIKGNPSRWKTFVENRVSQITKIIDSNRWQHVSTKENPADVITRGIEPTKLANLRIWWNGPDWLQDQQEWPHQIQELESPSDEARQCMHMVYNLQDDFLLKFSKLINMLRVLSYCRRFVAKCKKTSFENKFLTASELEDTLLEIAKFSQATDFAEEVQLLREKKDISKTSKIANLHPFLDEKGILRVGGRLQNSLLVFNEKHPIILSAKCHLTKLIIDNAHTETLHGGNQATLAYVRRKFWILNGKRVVRSYITKCVRCARFKGQASQQIMGNLPTSRVTPSPPFTHTGVDYAGPIQIRTTKGRGHKSYKGYIAVFICLSTKAIHLEVVSDMSMEAFLAAYKRFIARRGNVKHMYSDNGTTFVGASNILDQEVTTILNDDAIQEKLASSGIKWHFIPPAAPHFGGLWEAGVKSMKYHLKRIIGDSTLTYEEMSTLLCQIEACLNSRPLCPLTNDVNDIQALTPGHFLIGRELVAPPNPIDTPSDTNLTQRWKLLQKMKKDFWHVWSSEYLSRLQQRYKWKENQANLQTGDLVLIKEDINPSRWPLARISEVHPGNDGKVRVISLRKAGGNILKRPITKVVPLPVNNEISCEKPQQEPSRSTNLITISSKFWWILMLLFILIAKPIGANYTIYQPHAGLYVEHIGHSKIGRGTFRIELQYNLTKFEQDVRSVNQTIANMENLCFKMKTLTHNTPCENFLHHLQEMGKQVTWLRNGMNSLIKREKRGLLGQLMTSIFGVNDEVYRDIEALDKNQHELIRASNHQTKFMLSTLAAVNETEARINKKLQHFQEKLNAGIEAINQMSYWYSSVDANKLSIHVLSSYEIANNFIIEIIHYYSKLLNIQMQRGSLYDLIPPSHVHKIINEASAKLPSNLEILTQPLLKTNVRRNYTFINIYGYFPIVEKFDFTLMKITPVPVQIKDDSYWILDIPNDIVAVDYNSQLYFTLSDTDLRNAILINEDLYLCLPTVVRNIENSPSCVIDEIYQRVDKTTCDIKRNKITSLIWKELYAANTWMFITNKPTRAGITCNGIRQDVPLNYTGILQMSQDCIIQTKQNILSPKREDTIRVITAYVKHVPVDINSSLDHQVPIQLQPIEEPVIGVDDAFANLKKQEELEQQLQEDFNWARIKNHSTYSNIITAIIVLSIMFLIWLIHKTLMHCKRSKISPTRETIEPTNNTEEFELKSIYPITNPI